jgi:hypothetical protein
VLIVLLGSIFQGDVCLDVLLCIDLSNFLVLAGNDINSSTWIITRVSIMFSSQKTCNVTVFYFSPPLSHPLAVPLTFSISVALFHVLANIFFVGAAVEGSI